MNIKLMRPIHTAALLFLVTGILITGCEKPEGNVGLDLLPGEDILSVNGVDTFSIVSYTLEEDSVLTDNSNPALVGAYLDPVFGFAKASHVTELRLSTSNPDFLPLGTTIDQIVIDSTILSLDFQLDNTGNYIYGGSGAQFFQVFEISDSLAVDSFYYDTKVAHLIGEDLVVTGENLITPNASDSVQVGDLKVAPQVRIPLNNVLAEKIFTAGEDGPMTQAEFISLIRGICIKVDENQQNLSRSGIINFDTFNQGSGITIYYRNTNQDIPAELDTVAYRLDIRSGTGKFENFEQDYSRSNLSLNRQLAGDKAFGQRDLYIQSMAGTKLRIELPTIENLKDSVGLAINKAEIIVPVRSTPLKYLVPDQLYLFGMDEEERIYFTDDMRDIGTLNYGLYDSANEEYRLVVTRQIQQILLGQKENNPLEIVTSHAGNSANRVVINGPDYPSADNPSDNLKLVITYSKF